MNSAIKELQNPVFEPIKDTKEFKKILNLFNDAKKQM